MELHDRLAPSNGFRHLWRTLASGETVPRVPSLFEQLDACSRALRAAAETVEPAPQPAVEEVDDFDEEYPS